MGREDESFPGTDPVEILRASDPRAVATYSNTEFKGVGERGGIFLVPVLHSTLEVSYPGFVVSAPPELNSYPLKQLTLLYLARADGTALKGEWMPYRELPGGMFYEPVLKREVTVPLASEFGDDVSGFIESGLLLAGEEDEGADASVAFLPFPRIRLKISLWASDEEFPAEVKMLFDANSAHYLNAFEIKMLAGEIASRLSKIHRGEIDIPTG